MGKKLSKGKLRISKSISSYCTSHEKKNLNHLVKVLKPKVYIIDPSKFKCLVQELTGNGNNNSLPTPISSSPSISSIVSQPNDDPQIQFTQNDIVLDQDYCNGVQESSPEWSCELSCSELIDNVPLTTFDSWDVSEELNMSAQMFSNDMINQAHSSFPGSHELMSFPQVEDRVEYPWILEMNDPFVYNPFAYNYDNAFVTTMPPEVCDYAYDFSGIM